MTCFQIPTPCPDRYESGGGCWRDDFTASQLRPEWHNIGSPQEEWHSLTVRPGFLRLKARPHALTGPDQPSVLGIRQRHRTFIAETTLEFRPDAEGDAAGLAVMQHGQGLLSLECVQSGKHIQIRLIRQMFETGAIREVRAHAPLFQRRVALRVEAHGHYYAFFYGEKNHPWCQVGEIEDGTILSARCAGGFVGAYIGLYATSESDDSTGKADFARFTYRGKS